MVKFANIVSIKIGVWCFECFLTTTMFLDTPCIDISMDVVSFCWGGWGGKDVFTIPKRA